MLLCTCWWRHAGASEGVPDKLGLLALCFNIALHESLGDRAIRNTCRWCCCIDSARLVAAQAV